MSRGPIARPIAFTDRLTLPTSEAMAAGKGRTTLSPSPSSNAGRYVTRRRLLELEQSLSARDRAILSSLRQLRVATAHQLERLHFVDATGRHRRRALEALEQARLIVRLPRRIGGVRAGSAGSVFALDLAGQRLTDQRGPAGGRRLERPWAPGLSFLAHSLAVSELFVRLVEAHRLGQLELLDFHAEPACWRRFQTLAGGWATLKPDAALRLGAGAYEDHWFIEVDRGTEAAATIDRKANLYRSYWQSGREQAAHGVFPQVLWLVPDEPRAELLTTVLGRQPGEAARLHVVVPFAHGVFRLIEGPREGKPS